MSELQIENPTQTISHDISWMQLKENIIQVISTFPKEYTVVKDDIDNDKIILLNIPINQEGKAIANDKIIYITKDKIDENKTTVKIEITNEDNKISSYRELERDKKSLNVFVILLKKAIDKTLGKTVANLNKQLKPKVDQYRLLFK